MAAAVPAEGVLQPAAAATRPAWRRALVQVFVIRAAVEPERALPAPKCAGVRVEAAVLRRGRLERLGSPGRFPPLHSLAWKPGLQPRGSRAWQARAAAPAASARLLRRALPAAEAPGPGPHARRGPAGAARPTASSRKADQRPAHPDARTAASRGRAATATAPCATRSSCGEDDARSETSCVGDRPWLVRDWPGQSIEKPPWSAQRARRAGHSNGCRAVGDYRGRAALTIRHEK